MSTKKKTPAKKKAAARKRPAKITTPAVAAAVIATAKGYRRISRRAGRRG
jgi:hypothetical protein